MPVVGRVQAPVLGSIGRNGGLFVVQAARLRKKAELEAAESHVPQKSGDGFRTAPLIQNNRPTIDRSRSAFALRSDREFIESKL